MSDCASVTAESPVKVDVPMPSVEDVSDILKCGICEKDYVEPKALVCFHSFCKDCIDKNIVNGMITCPKCNVTMELGLVGAAGLLTDYGLVGLLSSKSKTDSIDACQGCMKSKDLSGKCNQCGVICNNCQFAHSHMLMFRDHVIEQYEKNPSAVDVMHCMNHEDQPLTHYCSSCTLPICLSCSLTAHIGHSIFLAKDVYSQHVQRVQAMFVQAKEKVSRMMEESEKLNDVYGQLQSCYESAYSNIDNIADLIIKETNEFKSNAQSLLDATHERWRKDAQLICQDYKKFAEKGVSMNDFAERLLERSDMLGFLFFSELLNTKMTSFMQFDESIISSMTNREFFHDIINIKEDDITFHLRTFFRNISKSSTSNPSELQEMTMPELDVSKTSQTILNSTLDDSGLPAEGARGNTSFHNQSQYSVSAQNISMQSNKVNTGSMMLPLTDSAHMNHSSCQIGPDANSAMQLNSSVTPVPARSPLKRHKMIYFLKFGEFGVNEGQFTEPSGIAVNLYREEIIIADTNGHRVQVFDREGRFKLEFGGCGKRDGQLLYPNRIAVNQITGNYFITERSPTHQIQIYGPDGHFIRKFGATVLQHPRGICVDHKGRVVVVECKVMRVIIFDSFGNVISKFGCGRYLEFPNAVCTSPDEEILISDNRAHCIKVFSYDGVFLRQIGGEGVTNYPIGVAVDRNGYIIVADNHNNFNLTIFDKHGRIVNALESKVKHAQCYDMALLDDGTVAVSSKDYRIYLYRYAMPTGNGGLTYLTLPVDSCEKFSSLE